MTRSAPPAPPTRRAAALAMGVAALLGGCAGGPSAGAPTPGASDAEWRALAAPRPTPLPGAARISVAELELLGDPVWPGSAAVPARLGLTELVVAGLLRRPDVRLVERRRFAAAVEAERGGPRRPAGAPAAGTSPGAELTATLTWVSLGTGQATVEVRLAETATGRVAASRRAMLPADAEPVALARAAVAALLATLGDLDRLPAWSDPLARPEPAAGPEPAAPADSGVPAAALSAFLAGLAAEERWRWEEARLGYQAAARAPGFYEADAALARTARLRLGGTLGES